MKYFLTIALFFMSFTVLSNTNEWEGRPMPVFSLQDQNEMTRTNEEFLGKWLVLYFYPKDKTPGCTIEAQKFTDDYPQFQKLGVEIVGVSLDDVASHKGFSDTYEMPFSLLADTKGELSTVMKVKRLFPIPHSSRQTFLINPKGVIVHHFASVEPKSHSKQLLNAIQALQKNENNSNN